MRFRATVTDSPSTKLVKRRAWFRRTIRAVWGAVTLAACHVATGVTRAARHVASSIGQKLQQEVWKANSTHQNAKNRFQEDHCSHRGCRSNPHSDGARSVYNAAREFVPKLGDEPTQEDVESATIEIDRLFAQDDESMDEMLKQDEETEREYSSEETMV